MTKTTNIFLVATIASFAAGAALAENTAFANKDRVTDTIEDIEDDIKDAAKRDVPAFGNTGRKMGWSGSVSGRATLSSGNSDSKDAGVGARIGYFDGTNGHRVNLAYSFAEANDTKSKDELLFGYDYTREFSGNLYGFGKIVAAYDDFDTYKVDTFVGAGIGYRILNAADQQWAIQAGPGYRYAENTAGKAVIKQGALSVSSYYTQKLTPTVSLFNDTDVIWSKEDTSVTNKLGLNVAMNNALALQTTLTTEYDSEPAAGKKNTDNTLGLSVVYSFN